MGSKLAKTLLTLATVPILASPILAKDAKYTGHFGGNARHFHTRTLNERNGITGAGKIEGDWEYFADHCINSYGHPTNWIGATKRKDLNDSVYIGYSFFAVDGYPQNNFEFTPGVSFMLGLKSRYLAQRLNEIFNLKANNIGVEFVIMPPKELSSEYLGLKTLENFELIIWRFRYEF